MIISSSNCLPTDPVGGKAWALASLTQTGFQIPKWFVITSGNYELPPLKGRYAVRSSAMAEDGKEYSFAGQYDSFLNILSDEIPNHIEKVRLSAQNERVTSYTENTQQEQEVEMAVIVQEMVDSKFAGVAFGADPITGERDSCLVSAVAGLGEALVSGAANSENWTVDRNDQVSGDSSLLSIEQIQSIAKLCRQCNAHFGQPQDIEWTIDQEGSLWLLQSRAITTLTTLPDPNDELTIWDNSNIAESYGGITTPLTFSFASRIYEHVYREFCKLLSVPSWKIRKHDQVFPQMLGLIRGRTYYNLVSWYRVLALLPGFSVNRKFMEQMMGVKKALPDEIVDKIIKENATSKLRDGIALCGTSLGLIKSFFTLPKSIKKFRKRLDQALALNTPLAEMRTEELISHYQNLEAQLLKKWDAPLVNDFFAMIFYGLLAKKNEDANTLLRDTGDIISARPPRLIQEMALLIDKKTATLLADPKEPLPSKIQAVRENPALHEKFTAYLAEFGDRCLEELKLESPTVTDDPSSLLTSIGGLALRGPRQENTEVEAPPKVSGFLQRWILSNARSLLRNRENLRFERTRVFGRVRAIIRELGSRLVTDGQLQERDDVFFLKLDEVLDSSHTTSLKPLVTIRKKEFEDYRKQPEPPDRFQTRGSLSRYKTFGDENEYEDQEGNLKGIGACPGIVRGKVRVVTNPREAQLEPGEILVATQTDPGWVVLFPAASGLLVERGSLLSHSAIVARELQLPCIVSLSNITKTLTTGDQIEMNGKTGQVTLLNHEE